MTTPTAGSESSPNGVQAVIDALYRDFLLRDLFAKIVPGSIVLLTMAEGTGMDLASTVEFLGPDLAAVVVFAGTAWLTGFGIQGLGELTGLIQHHPKSKGKDHDENPGPGEEQGENYDDSTVRYGVRIQFKQVASRAETRRVERYAIIKEAAGNGGTAVLLACSMIGFRWLIQGLVEGLANGARPPLPWELIGEHAVTGVTVVFLAIMLLYTNRTHTQKQYQYMERVLARHAPLE